MRSPGRKVAERLAVDRLAKVSILVMERLGHDANAPPRGAHPDRRPATGVRPTRAFAAGAGLRKAGRAGKVGRRIPEDARFRWEGPTSPAGAGGRPRSTGAARARRSRVSAGG